MGSGAELEEIETLYRSDFPRFLRVAIAITGNREAARDAVQDAFANAIQSRRRFRGEAPLEAWVWRAVVNASRRRNATGARSSRHALSFASPNGAVPSEAGGLESAIARLPERQRLAVFLRYYADLDYQAIAAALGVKPGTVSATLHAARSNLRRTLAEEER